MNLNLVDVGAVAAAQIHDGVLRAVVAQQRVPPRDELIPLQHDIARRRAANRYIAAIEHDLARLSALLGGQWADHERAESGGVRSAHSVGAWGVANWSAGQVSSVIP